MALPDRSLIRAEFAGLLTAALVGDGKLAQAIYHYSIGDIGGQTPVLVLGSSGTERKPFTARGSRPSYLLNLWVFVLYAEMDFPEPDGAGKLVLDATGQPVWDENDSEQALDQLEDTVRVLLDGNQKGASWKAVDYAGPTDADIIPIGGTAYRRELIPLRFECY